VIISEFTLFWIEEEQWTQTYYYDQFPYLCVSTFWIRGYDIMLDVWNCCRP